jgi:hypothetical protein
MSEPLTIRAGYWPPSANPHEAKDVFVYVLDDVVYLMLPDGGEVRLLLPEITDIFTFAVSVIAETQER